VRLSLTQIYEILREWYGPQYWWPIVMDHTSHYLPEYTERERTPEEALEIWIGAILTQNTAWKNVEKAIDTLKTHLPLTPQDLLSCPETTLASLIRSAGYYTQKAKKIRISMRFILEHLDGNPCSLRSYPLSTARERLLSLWGIGPETADSILLYALGFPVFVIDAYTRRILSHLGYTEAFDPYEDLQDIFHTSLPRDPRLYGEYHALFVAAGKTCGRKPRCEACPLHPWCQAHPS